jgi:hypothetical protein
MRAFITYTYTCINALLYHQHCDGYCSNVCLLARACFLSFLCSESQATNNSSNLQHKATNSVKLVKSLIMKFCVYLLSAKGRNTALLRTSNQACMHHHYYSICMYVCKVKHVSVVTDAQHLCCCCVKPLALVYVCINTTSHTPIVCE